MIEKIYSYYTQSYKVSTDSRHIEPNAVFFALKGERFDGNDFALDVAEQGVASLVIADRADLPEHPRILKVDDSLATLQALAHYHRMQMHNLRVIGITGTNGKTTTKELISAVLSKKYEIIYTQGNYNNHIGVPLTLLSITPTTQIAVVEMGANHPKEIKALTDIACPDFGIITNIGKAHLEGFGSFEGVIATKKEMYDHLREHGKTLFVNRANDLLWGLSEGHSRISYGCHCAADYPVATGPCKPYLCVKTKPLGTIQTQLVGSYNFENVAAAIAVGSYFGVEADDIKEALQNYRPTNSRSQVIEGRNRIIMDAYNANPTSMNASIRNFHAINGENPVLILGDMRELGDASEQEHKTILHLLEELGFQQAYLVGPCFCQYNDNTNYLTFADVQQLSQYLEEHPLEGHTMLVKGSRGIQLEKILPQIQ